MEHVNLRIYADGHRRQQQPNAMQINHFEKAMKCIFSNDNIITVKLCISRKLLGIIIKLGIIMKLLEDLLMSNVKNKLKLVIYLKTRYR